MSGHSSRPLLFVLSMALVLGTTEDVALGLGAGGEGGGAGQAAQRPIAERPVVAGRTRPPVVEAARRGDLAALQTLIDKGADVNVADADGTTALHWASDHDHLEMAEALLRAGARVAAANDLGATPLWSAALNGSGPMVTRLLDAGANPNAALLLGETPLMVAARTGSADVVSQLLARGAHVNARAARDQTALMWAAANMRADVVGVLIAHGADVHARSATWSQVMAVPPHGLPQYNRDIPHGHDTALMFAVRAGDLASTRLLVEAGANVNDRDAWGVSATVLAAHAGHTELVEYLLARGSDARSATAGFAAIHPAVMRRDVRMVRALLEHGADPNEVLRTWTPTRRSSNDFHFPPELVGATPFWLAARFNAPEIMKVLAEHGADPKVVHRADYHAGDPPAPRSQVTNALMAATGMGGGVAWAPIDRGRREAVMLETVKVAFDLGADINATNVDGRTALDAATAAKYESVVAFLVEKGATRGASMRAR